MQDIGNLKSVIYGAIITIIFVVSSCEFDSNKPLTNTTSNSAIVSLMQ